jgi:antirestriction protein ArdC
LRQYKDPAAFYSTAFHEAAHSTGIEARLARAGLKKASFGSEIYSKEELTAEISACVLTNTLQIETDHSVQNSTAYIRGWLKALQNDRRLIVQAAGQAEKAVNMILNM